MMFVISSEPPLMPATLTRTSPISSGIFWPCASAGLEDVHVTRELAGSVIGVARPLETITYGDPSTEIVTGATRSFVATNVTGPMGGTGVVPSPLHATKSAKGAARVIDRMSNVRTCRRETNISVFVLHPIVT